MLYNIIIIIDEFKYIMLDINEKLFIFYYNINRIYWMKCIWNYLELFNTLEITFFCLKTIYSNLSVNISHCNIIYYITLYISCNIMHGYKLYYNIIDQFISAIAWIDNINEYQTNSVY